MLRLHIQPLVHRLHRLIAVPVTLKLTRQLWGLVAVAVTVLPVVTACHQEQTALRSLTGAAAILFIPPKLLVQYVIPLVVLAVMQIMAEGIEIQIRQWLTLMVATVGPVIPVVQLPVMLTRM